MRPKVAIVVLTISILAAAAVLLIPKPAGSPAVGGSSPTVDAPPDAGATNAIIPLASHPKPDAPSPQIETNSELGGDDADAMSDSPEAKHEAYKHARILELQDLGSGSDPDSLESILSELGNRDPDIRAAAVAAAVQFGSRDAIPQLEDAELQAEDPHEKAAIADAIDFLKLPNVTEIAGRKASQTESSTPH
jgi:hypothetical protein